MGKKVEVSYNPQLGYLQTIFHHNFDFLTGIKSYTERTDGVEFVVDTYKENTVKVFIQCVGETAFRFRMYTPGNEHPFDNSIYQLEGQNGVNITENEEFISISKGKIEARVRKYPWEVSYYLDGKLKTKEQIKDSNVDNMCKNLPVGFTYDENKEIIGVNETMYLYADEEFYGFGEKFTDFGKRGQTINCWQTDALSTNTEKSYKNHPFFMSSKVRSVVSMGIGAVKTDFSEAVPEDAVYFDGSTGIQGHNKLTFLYAKTIYDIMAEVKIPLGELPMLWGRSGYAGSHTIPAAWAGDSSTHLNNHACILRGGLSASMSGIPFWGFDMGGFYNTDHEGYECVPTDEEYIRSCQFGFFNSLSRCHGKTPREPWNFGEKAEKIFKKFNDIRHLLLPYLYSTTYKTHLSDIPVIRPVVMEYPEDRSARNVELEYFLGDSLLVVPVFDQEDEIDVYLPNGQWIDLFTHERIKGGRWVKRKIELDKIPVFIRQNKMIPMLTKIPENIEEKYENLDVILFCEDEIRDTYIDDGNVQNLKAKIEEGTLFINTDMDASYFTVYAEKCLDNAVVNGQNWEIKKEKEGYYKIALEK